jgi:hypothetical protein
MTMNETTETAGEKAVHSAADWIRGALRSLTVKFAALLALLPDILGILQAQFDTVRPFIPDALESRWLQVIALIILMLRIRTTTALPKK